jgi:hypothetical protein
MIFSTPNPLKSGRLTPFYPIKPEFSIEFFLLICYFNQNKI